MRLGSCITIILALVYPSCQFTSDETCEFCTAVLRGVHGFFASSSSAPSKRVLARQLKHHCNRYSNYRGRCLVLLKTHFSLLLDAMRHTPFKSTDTCFAMNECRPGPVETVAPIVPIDIGPLEKELDIFFSSLGQTIL